MFTKRIAKKEFSEIQQGELFCSEQMGLYIKICKVGDITAVNLETGENYCFKNSNRVMSVRYEALEWREESVKCLQ